MAPLCIQHSIMVRVGHHSWKKYFVPNFSLKSHSKFFSGEILWNKTNFCIHNFKIWNKDFLNLEKLNFPFGYGFGNIIDNVFDFLQFFVICPLSKRERGQINNPNAGNKKWEIIRILHDYFFISNFILWSVLELLIFSQNFSTGVA